MNLFAIYFTLLCFTFIKKFYEVILITGFSNAVMAVVGPGSCFPLLTDAVKHAHGLCSFAFVSKAKQNGKKLAE